MSYKNFRENYPQASLITELLQVDHGQYIVRALIQQHGITLCCGLSSDRSVEVAEDQAVERVLRFLNVEEELEKIVKDSEDKQKLKKYEEQILESSDNKNLDQKEEMFIAPPMEMFEQAKKPLESITVENILPKDEREDTPESSESTLACESLDFSEIIAKTNRELKRLDWSTQQGKDHLMQTYGKRSRQLLSDEELLDFLKFLESQPTPNGLF